MEFVEVEFVAPKQAMESQQPVDEVFGTWQRGSDPPERL
jgi:hypothetical protein